MDVRALQTADLLSTHKAVAHRKPTGGGAEAASGSFAGVLQQVADKQATRTATTTTDTTDKTDKAADAAEKADIKLRRHETLKDVDGRAFSEIDGGKRDGLYVNTSGNVRHGQTFTMTVRNGRELHIYGTGADRVIVSLPVKRDKDDGDDRQSSSTVNQTGGASVPTATQRD